MFKKCFLVGIFTLLSVSLAIADPPAVHPTTGESLVIDCFRGTPDAIDGDLSDWNLEAMTPAVLDVAEQLHSGQDSWTGPEDCSGEFYLMWDDVNIYMAVVAKDDVLSMNKSGGDIWNADAVEVFFSTLNAVAGHDEHYQYGFNANNQRWNWCNMDGAGGVEPGYLQIASSVTADGYICEASVEYGQMLSLDFSAGNSIGFHAVFDDTDIVDGDRELQMTWTGREAHDQSLGYGHIVLSADPVPAAEEVEKTVLFAEDFEGVVLGPNIDEVLAGDAVWTDTPPEGWIVDESGIPGLNLDATDGVTEWAGWAFTDKAWWIEAAEDQDRSMFELGSGIVAVADPDEWDDDERLPIPIAVDPYDTWLTTPEIKIGAAEAGTLELKFDSSWRPEFDDNYHQTANITASFDGGDPVEVMLWESDEASPNYHPYATNETVVVKLDNPEGAKRVVLTFGLFDAGNDWWWAIDNIEVRGYIPSMDPVKPSTEGLVAYYALDGDVTDSSGNGLDGTIMGDPAFAEGKIGMALDLDGDGDYVDCGTNDTLNGLNEAMTASAWINIRSITTAWMAVMAKGENAWRISTNGDTLGLHFGFSGGDRGWQAANSESQVALDEWHHVAATYDLDNGGQIYIDGALDASNPDLDGVQMNEMPFLIGENPEATGRFFDGLIDEVMVYNRTLSEAEIRYLAGERAMPIDPGSDGLLAWWACDEGEGNVVADVSGNGRDGVFVNGDPAWVEGVYGNAVELVGPTLIETPPLDLELTEATMAGWIKPNGPQPDWSSFIMQRDPGLATGFNVLGYQLAYHWNDTSDSWSFRGGDMIAEDDWTFAAVTIEPDQATFYVNGDKGSVNEITHGPCLWNSNVYLGGDGTEGWVSRRMNGALDEVVIYDRALSVGEIRYLAGFRPPLVAAFAFGSRLLECPTYNIPSINYTIVLHDSPESVQYDPARGYGYEVLYPADSPYGDRAGYGVFGPFDDSPNGRNKFPDELPEEIYDSFIGAKSFLDDCSADIMGDMDTPCDVPEGIIFRVDVPNGLYRFVGAFGDADNVHAHRILAEDGGSGPPENIGANYVVLVSNHDQAQQTIGEAEAAEPGEGVFARVGFDDKIPPPGDGIAPSPQFVDMDENGMPTEAGANSPVLEVTQGYIRIHQLQGNSNDGPGGPRDANGGDIVILELWKID